MRMKHIHLLIALGTGWDTAVAETKEEMGVIYEGNRGLGNDDPYWIGGTTSLSGGTTFPYSEYLTEAPGKKY